MISLNRLELLTNAAKLAVIGLIATAAGMLIQIAAGSKSIRAPLGRLCCWRQRFS